MLDLKFVRDNLDLLGEKTRERGLQIDFGPLKELEADRRQLLKKVEDLRQRRNTVSREIAARKQRREDAGDDILAMREVSDRIKELEQKMRESDEALRQQLYELPNLQDATVPVGTDEDDNVEVRRWGSPPVFDFTPLPHWEVGEKLGILDFERASKITGARFSLSWGPGARMERALINFMLDLHTVEHGYREVLPPFIVNGESLLGTGQLPKFENDLFRLEGGRFYLIPTAEVPLTNIHRDEILQGSDLPAKYTAYTPCFRREAGAHGKDTRGLIRQHQFNTVELVKFVEPEKSPEDLESLVREAEEVLVRLGLPYRVIVLCTGDLGFSSAKTYDIEVWMPGQQRYREISSCSNFLDYQARRASIRYRPERSSKPRLVHTLNGSGLAAGRTVAAILENFQAGDGSVAVPEALLPYMGGISVLQPGAGGPSGE
jgi:seryl-tRNA synthetase